MVNWRKLFGLDRGADRLGWRNEHSQLLPSYHDGSLVSAISPQEVTKVALRLRYLVQECVSCELEESQVTHPHSRVITKQVIQAAREAGGNEHRACVVFGLLVNIRWFKKQAVIELWDSGLYNLRALACEVIAKRIIESEEDMGYLMHEILLKRYSILVNNEPTSPANVVERAVDQHALLVMGSSGYQKVVSYLWRGWLIQDENDPSNFVDYKKRGDVYYWHHVDPDRMRAPVYQNATQVIFSILYLALYTAAVNTVNPNGDLDVIEGLLYVFTAGFIFDEAAKFWKVGKFYLGFWNVFNLTLYSLLTISLIIRFVALSHPIDSHRRGDLNELSYNFLSFSAPMFWMRLFLYLDSIRFFGTMLVVLKVMMKESLIFFALLVAIVIGFLQAFIGMDFADTNADATKFILQAMANAVMQAPDFDGFDNFAPPFGIILYYIFTFLIMVILLNILIALYNSAYQDITDNAIDEYMALFSQKTIQFVRAPDENVFIAPLNLIEIFFLILPFEWWLPKKTYMRLNDYVMSIVYSPLLIVAAYFETRSARAVRRNRGRGEEDDDTTQEWEQMDDQINFQGEGWDKTVLKVKPNVEEDPATVECRQLRKEIKDLKEIIMEISKKTGSEK
ncbi:hypothetical protein F5884DRAFT_794587 [Xylogone sp. PMI_703]|nr:hypothetical protein F5884DRAFT_794587 [Xylogone sp. PMI_703]